MSIAIGVIGIILAFAALMFLSFKDWSPLYTGFIVTAIVIFTNGLPVGETITNVYLPGVASFAGPYFGMMLFGAIMGKVYDVSGAATAIAKGLVHTLMPEGSKHSDSRRVALGVFIICIAGAILTYGGINNVVLMLTMYPLAVSVCKEVNIPQRFAIGIAVTGITTFAFCGPFSPQMPNVAAMDLMGTTSSAALIPGIAASLVEIVVMVGVFTVLVNRARAGGESFHYGPNDTVHDDSEDLPNPWIGVIPLAFIFITFNVFKLNITVAMALGAILSILLFHKYLKPHGVLKIVNAGAASSTATLLLISAIVGFGAVVNTTEAYQAIISRLLALSIHPYFQLIICIWAFAAIAGSATAGIRLALPTLGPLYTGMGYPASAIHRIAAFAGTVTDSLPSAGAVMMGCQLSGNSMKDAYPGIFVSTVLATAAGTLTAAILLILFPMLA